MQTIGIAIIAKNEEENLPRLLANIEGHFDQVVLVDTGSKDGTIGIMEAWADKQTTTAVTIQQYEWCDDFGAARAYADSFLTTDWNCWADCDDVIHGIENMRRMVEDADPEIAAYICGYNYVQDGRGKCVVHLRRERLVRQGKGHWEMPVHEAQRLDGSVSLVPDEVIQWVHLKPAESHGASNPRNLRILNKWNKREPNNPRIIAYLGTENMGRGKFKVAARHFRKYLDLHSQWDEERAQVHYKLAECYMQMGEPQKAIKVAMDCILFMPSWPDSYLSLAKAHLITQEWPKAIEWAQEALRRGKPETMLIVSPMDYDFAPRKIAAAALGELKQWDAARELAREALDINPADVDLQGLYAYWTSHSKREHTADTYVMAAQQLVQHDEQLKALKLLDCVPHFAIDHTKVAQMRAGIRQRIFWLDEDYATHYVDGGSKPEDFVHDDMVDPICNSLPRVQALVQVIEERTNG